MIDDPKGCYRFLQGGGPGSSGCCAAAGYEIIHAVFHSLPPLEAGFDLPPTSLPRALVPTQQLASSPLRGEGPATVPLPTVN
jgi:hypothetical protein